MTETLGCRRDGSTFPMEVEHGELTLGERSLVLAFVRDISERKAYTEDLAAPGAARRSHRLGQSHPVQRARAQGDRLGRAHRRAAGRPGDGSERLQAGQRHARTRAGRQPAQTGRRPPRRGAAGDRHDRPARWRRVRDPSRRDHGPGRRRGTGLEGPADLRGRRSSSTSEPVYVTASVGIAMFPEHGRTTEELLRRADVAMYIAKRSGSGHAVVDAEQEEETAQQLALLADLRQCISRDELILHYQPKIDLETNEVVRRRGAAALAPSRPRAADARQLHRRGGEHRADRAGDEVGAQRGAAPAAASGSEQGIDLTMAVNVSARSLGPRSTLPDIVRELTETWETPAGPADPGADRGRADRRERARDPRSAARHGRDAVDRRLRHRVLVAGLPAAAPGGRDQDRQVVRHRPVGRQRRRRHRPLDDRPRPQSRPHGRRRGRRGRGDDGDARRLRMRPSAGIFLRAAPVRPRSSPSGCASWTYAAAPARAA